MAWGNVQFTDGTTTVTVKAENVKRMLAKTVTTLNMPVPRGSKETQDPRTLIVDLKRVTLKFVVRGYLIDEPGGDNHVTQAVKLLSLAGAGKSDRIIGSAIAQSGARRTSGVCKMTWGSGSRQESYWVNLEKIEITEDASNAAGDRFDVMISVVAGEDR